MFRTCFLYRTGVCLCMPAVVVVFIDREPNVLRMSCMPFTYPFEIHTNIVNLCVGDDHIQIVERCRRSLILQVIDTRRETECSQELIEKRPPVYNIFNYKLQWWVGVASRRDARSAKVSSIPRHIENVCNALIN